MIGSSGEAQSPDSLLLPYCVFIPRTLHVPESGVLSGEVRRLEAAGLAAIYSPLASTSPARDRLQQSALEFHRVVHAVFAQQAVVPFRFPTLVSEAELREHMAARSSDYAGFLRQHADDVQMEVRITFAGKDTSAPALSGTEHMRQRLSRVKQLRAAADLLRQQSRVTKEWRERETRDALRLFALVARASVAALREKLAEFHSPAGIGIRVSGPWPATEFLPEKLLSF